MALGQHPQALLTMLYRSTDRRCLSGAPVKNLSHSASFHCWLNNAPSNARTKHLEAHGLGVEQRRAEGIGMIMLHPRASSTSAPRYLTHAIAPTSSSINMGWRGTPVVFRPPLLPVVMANSSNNQVGYPSGFRFGMLSSSTTARSFDSAMRGNDERSIGIGYLGRHCGIFHGAPGKPSRRRISRPFARSFRSAADPLWSPHAALWQFGD